MKKTDNFPIKTYILMAATTFVAIVTELIPTGVAPLMQETLGITQAQQGSFMGWFALASAIGTIPLVSGTAKAERRKLLLIILGGYTVSNLIIGLVPNYHAILFARVLGGVFTSMIWSMISAYGAALTTPENSGRAIAIIMAGSTVGVSVGVPLFTYIGKTFGWQVEFIALAVLTALIAFLCYKFLPQVEGTSASGENSPLALVKIPGVQRILVLTLLTVLANYGVYTYIANQVEWANYPSIELAQIFFGLGSILSAIIAGRYLDTQLRKTTVGLIAATGIAYILFLVTDARLVQHISYLIWGIGYGAMTTFLQTGIGRQVSPEARGIANSLQSCCFNISIMLASSVGGQILQTASGMTTLLITMSAVSLVGATIASSSRKYLGD